MKMPNTENDGNTSTSKQKQQPARTRKKRAKKLKKTGNHSTTNNDTNNNTNTTIAPKGQNEIKESDMKMFGTEKKVEGEVKVKQQQQQQPDGGGGSDGNGNDGNNGDGNDGNPVRTRKKRTRAPKKRSHNNTITETTSASTSTGNSTSNSTGTSTSTSTGTSNFNKNQHQNNPYKKRPKISRRGPTPEAMQLSSQLKEFSIQKNLQDCLDLYWNNNNNANDRIIRDGHHACIVIDCCGRCGSIQQGEEIYHELEKSGEEISVHTKTALLKGYAHSGMLSKASQLYHKMMEDTRRNGDKNNGYGHSGRRDCDRPNVRTLNTLLRGCLWTAASLTKDTGRKGATTNNNNTSTFEVSGGVITLDKAWPKKTNSDGVDVDHLEVIPDLSSYEYAITLLSQALRFQEAENRLVDLTESFKVNTSKWKDGGVHYTAEDSSTLETVCASFLNIARAYAMLGDFSNGTSYAKKAVDVVTSTQNTSTKWKNSSGRGVTKFGGKRAWKQVGGDDTNVEGKVTGGGQQSQSRRDESNSLFRAHKLEELSQEASMILNTCSCRSNDASWSKYIDTNASQLQKSQSLAHHIFTRILYFSGGGTTDLSASQGHGNGNSKGRGQSKSVSLAPYNYHLGRLQLLNSLWLSFGLKEAFKAEFPNSNICSKQYIVNLADYNSALEALNMGSSHIVKNDGKIDFSVVFSGSGSGRTSNSNSNSNSKTDSKRELNIELGSGFGEWAVYQAQANPSCDYVAVEMRSDRVGQMFSRAYLNNGGDPITNLCSVGSECGSFLRTKVKKGSVSKIFVNHPEPPTQTYGANDSILDAIAEGSEEPAHMLTSATLSIAAACLDPDGGEIIIVTDNRWYANLICSSALKVMKENSGLISTSNLNAKSGIRQVDVFYGKDPSQSIILYEGQPNEAIGHSTQRSQSAHTKTKGSTYFDRLWRKGAGNHAEREKRFIICLTRGCKKRTNINMDEKKKPKKKKRNSTSTK